MTKLDVQSYVNEHNYMIEAAYNLSAIEQKLIIAMASMIDENDTEFKTYKLKISDFLEFIDSTDQKKYKQLPKITKGLMQKVMHIRTMDNDLIQVAWLSSAVYRHKQGILELEFSPKLKPYLLELKEEVTTRFQIGNIGRLKSKYSIRIYRLLKENMLQGITNPTYAVDDLRTMFGIEPGEYKLYGHLKDKVLNVAQQELKEKTDLRFEIEEDGPRRKVTSITFKIYNNEPASLNKALLLKKATELIS